MNQIRGLIFRWSEMDDDMALAKCVRVWATMERERERAEKEGEREREGVIGMQRGREKEREKERSDSEVRGERVGGSEDGRFACEWVFG